MPEQLQGILCIYLTIYITTSLYYIYIADVFSSQFIVKYANKYKMRVKPAALFALLLQYCKADLLIC